MPRAKIRLDHGGIAAVLKSRPVAAEVVKAAEKVATAARGQGYTAWDKNIKGRAVRVPLPVDVDPYVTDRAAALVTITHPAGIGMQAKHGVLTRAAGSV